MCIFHTKVPVGVLLMNLDVVKSNTHHNDIQHLYITVKFTGSLNYFLVYSPAVISQLLFPGQNVFEQMSAGVYFYADFGSPCNQTYWSKLTLAKTAC